MRRNRGLVERIACRITVLSINLLIRYQGWVIGARTVLARIDLRLPAGPLLALHGLALPRLAGGLERLVDCIIAARSVALSMAGAIRVEVAAAIACGIAKIVGVRSAPIPGLSTLAGLPLLAGLTLLSQLSLLAGLPLLVGLARLSLLAGLTLLSRL